MKAYKGFNKDLTCRDFQYEEGEEYITDKAVCCSDGFHACEYPLDCFQYYTPNNSVYHEVDQDGELSRSNEDSKIASTKIKIGVRLSIADMVKAAIDFTMSRIKPEAKSNENCGASSATGYKGASSATGDYGASSATGNCGASSATGDYGASSATGNCGASSATGYRCSAEAKDSCAIAVAWGYKGKAKGVLGSRIVLADWEGNEDKYWEQNEWELKGAKMVKIDGKRYKPDVWYTMKNGKIVEEE